MMLRVDIHSIGCHAETHTHESNHDKRCAPKRVLSTNPSNETSDGGDMLAKNASKVGPRYPQVVVMVGATGDLSRRRLLPGLFHLGTAGFIPGCRIIGVSLDDLDPDGFRKIAREALDQFSSRKVEEADWAAFCGTLDYVPMSAGAGALKAAVEAAERSFAGESRRVHYLSVPPGAAVPAVRLLAEAGLVERSRVIMEKP